MVTVSSQKTSVSQSDSQRGGRVLRVGPLKPSLMDTLVTEYDALELPEGDDRDEFLSEHGASISAVVTSGRTGVDAALMERLPQLGAVVNFGVGYDTTDVDAAAERGVVVSNTPDVLTDCVADLAVGLVIDTVRGLSSAERFVRAGRWPTEGNTPLTRQVTGKRVGIIGLGRIGSAIADRLNGFRCEISYHNRNEIDGSPYVYAASPTALAENVDVLIIAASGGSGTAHLVDRAVLEALGPQGYLINVARGSVVDEEALIELLAAGKLAGAGLDVFAHEPNVPDALVAMDSAVLLPHVGSATVETRAAMEALTLENLDRFLADGTLVTPVTR
ncbi:2-hydroxyacid dehydrogenase [Rhodococcus sp. IEGM 1401]|uniref:2-hydroxyacid dehydrogenase n=1 Tax=unclassified Rhodococcus (in: high G+C Gram-positive bacteria) TaxID=192944 RepID=UPI0022B4C3FE|nr:MULTISPECIES: 2-hydroxyacid dehydrogenase [unclassified Rhodococcus (in: high G+C Gram-positive bacteria)]MCZ4561722.1 2-hydroxyacid dehydrogenase [Rhodococcus sp. IEGM 1401]MDI9921895.1 2-hydroxyacid dehydrogenase [Rhodococcus sp. IEGM 1372]MDV8034317.1 2-hydroxyacid dehydrogenase [Rhodococcus sp. IEGM 1414]MDV8078787.1 2-hydroxyacid dehydrogenase [Rhodococcus sp. IEGM 1370]